MSTAENKKTRLATAIERLMFLHSECAYHHCTVDRHDECPRYQGITFT